MALEIRGFSARAAALVVKLSPDPAYRCDALMADLASLKTLDAPTTLRWERAAAAARTFEVGSSDASSVGVAAYAEAADGTVIQGACTVVTFEELGAVEDGRIVVTLSERQ